MTANLYRGRQEINDEVGVATAWLDSSWRSDLYIEATKMKGKGLTLTASLTGEVMKESAQTAIGYIRSSKASVLKRTPLKKMRFIFTCQQNPSQRRSKCRITLATAIVSLLTGCPIHRKIAMTEMLSQVRSLSCRRYKRKSSCGREDGYSHGYSPL